MNVPLWISPKRSALTLSFMGLGEPFGMVIWAADAPRPRWKVILPTAIVERYLTTDFQDFGRSLLGS